MHTAHSLLYMIHNRILFQIFIPCLQRANMLIKTLFLFDRVRNGSLFRMYFFSTIKQSPETTIFDIKHAYIYRTDALDFCYNKPIIYILALYFCPHILWPISQQSIFSMENVLVSGNKDWVWGSCVNLIDAQNLEPLVKTSARK